MTREQAINYLYSSGMSDEQVMEVVEALEQEPCKDCVSRQFMYELGATCIAYRNDKQELIPIISIDSLPPVTPQPKTGWIPVSERLPEDIKPVIVTWKNTDPKSYYQYIIGKHFIGTAHYKNGAWFWYSSTTEDMLAEYGRCDSEEFDEAIEVVAWMPLPEPYKADGGETNE